MFRLACLMLVLLPAVGLAAPPNVVLILADDLGVNDLACYGRTEHRTPNLDRLAKEGVRFKTAYASASICSPTRAALMTGYTPAYLHITTFLPGRADAPSQKVLHPKIASFLPISVPTLPGLLKKQGYVTGCFGKWHLGGKDHQPTDHGFDKYYPGKANTPPSEIEGGKGEYDLTAKANAFVKENREKPFFLYLAHNTPHIPYTAKPALIEQYQKAFEPTYAAVIHSMDEVVGQLLDTLKELKLEENTLVIFTSDNGGLHVPELKHTRITHSKPLRAGKGYLYEGGLRVPLIVRWPGKLKAGQEPETPVISHDLPATILDVVGVKPLAMHGVSLLKLMQGQPLAERHLYWHQPHYTNQGGRPAGAVRSGEWKLIQQDEDNSLELYNLKHDLGEKVNLASKQPELVKKLRDDLEAWRVAMKAQRTTPNPNFDAAKHKPLYVEFDSSQYDTTDEKQQAAVLEWRKAMDAAVKK